jgi:DNA repair exonuclease SbcCD ATPase subunit
MSDFIENFRTSLEGLEQFHQRFLQMNTSNLDFSKDVSTKLQRINQSINVLKTKIGEYISKIATLEQQIQQNQNDAGSNQAQVQQLTQENQQLQTTIDQQQQQMSELTSQLTALNQEKENLEQQQQQLNQEKAALQQIVDGHPEQAQKQLRDALDQQQEECQKRIDALQQQIQELTQRLNENNTVQLSKGQTVRQNQQQIDELQKNNQELLANNQQLKQLIETGTQQINDILAQVQNLPSGEFTNNIQLINGLINEINKNLDEIEGPIQMPGTPVPGPMPMPGPPVSGPIQMPKLVRQNGFFNSNSNPNIQIYNSSIPFNTLIQQLKTKINNMKGTGSPRENKYSDLLSRLQNAQNENEINQIIELVKTDQMFKQFLNGNPNPTITGGRKTRRRIKKSLKQKKTKKQKGGFIYNTHSKRMSAKRTPSRNSNKKNKTKRTRFF